MINKRIAEDILEFKQQYIEFLNEQLDIPRPILEKYDIVSLINESKRSQVFLIADKQSKEQYLLKVFDTPKSVEKKPVIKYLNHPRIPRFIDIYMSGGKTYLIREYFDGRSLAEYLQERGSICASDMRNIAMQICNVLIYLHGREKPVIYRDIKAENVIITKDKDIKLVDFDISREYDESVSSDTVYYGTKEYSPPEQFGYSQTDARTDIYSLGILMLFMLTGSKDKESLAKIKEASYKRIIGKCLSFAPKDRYASVSTLKKALGKARKSPKMIRVRNAIIFSAVILMLGVLIGIGIERQGVVSAFVANDYDAANGNEQVVFQSELIEQAVRLQLDKDESKPVYVSELQGIESLHICGTEVFDGSQRLLLDYMANKTEQQLYFESYNGQNIIVKRGNIDTLEDVIMMKNLKILDIMFQNISDISALENLPIERLQLAGNNISDLTPLESLPLINYLNIDGNPIMDISPLSHLERLQVLDASETYIHDLSALENLHSLDSLYINNAKISDVSPLENLDLSNCFLQGNQISDFSPLKDVENLYIENNS